MKMKKIILISIFLLITIMMFSLDAFALETKDAINAMKPMEGGGTADATTKSKLGPIINAAIALIQIAGTGISLVMVTMLGIKYLLAAPSDKADVKKQITPMLIGAIVLFGSVNIVQIIANFTPTIFGKSS